MTVDFWFLWDGFILLSSSAPISCYLSKRMSEEASTTDIKVELQINSLDKDRNAVQLIELVKQHKSELLARLNSEFPGVQITEIKIESKPKFPGAAEIVAAIVLGIATGVGTKIGEKFGDSIIGWIEDTFHDVDIIQLHLNESKDSSTPSA